MFPSSVLDCRRELKHRLNLLSGDSGKPLNEFVNGGAVFEVLEKCPNRHSRFGEDPSPADLGWVGSTAVHCPHEFMDHL